MQELPAMRSTLSCSFVEKKLFSWICSRYKNTDVPGNFIEYLDIEAKKNVQSIKSWIPIANLVVQNPFPVSRSEIRTFSKEIIDNWETKVSSVDGKNNEDLNKSFEKIRKEFQGFAAVVTVIEAEPGHASDFAMEEAKQITSIMGIFSGATQIPDIKCVSNIKGSENIAQATTFFDTGEDSFQMTRGILDAASAKHWKLDQKKIIKIRKIGLDKISMLLASDSLGEFEKSVLNSILLYSKSAFTSDPVEKVVYILSSLESILLKNKNEPIQQNLGERVAVFTAQKLEDRKAIIKTIKSIYGVRSRYLHHGHTSSELELISRFMRHIWIFFIQLLENVDRFHTQEEFVNAIDDKKLS